MLGFLSKLLGGNKSEKDVKKIVPYVAQINQFFTQYQSLSNDQLRNNTLEFRKRIKEHLEEIEGEIATKKQEGEELPADQLTEKDAIYQEVDKLIKQKDEKIEEI